MSELYLVEHQHQVYDLVSRGMRDKGQWIALGPSAMWALEQEKISYRIPEDFYSVENLENLSLKTHKKVEWLCCHLDNIILEKFSDLKQQGIRPLLFHIFALNMLFVGLVGRIFKLRAILDAHPGHTVYVHNGPHYQPSIFGIGFSNRETLWSHLLTLPGWDIELKLLKEPERMTRDPLPSLRSKIGSLREIVEGPVKSSILGYTIMKHVKSKEWSQLWNFLGSNARGTILINGSVYEWADVLPLLRSAGWNLIYSSQECFGKYKIDANKDIEPLFFEDDRNIMDCFQYCGVSFYPLLKGRFLWLIEDSPALYTQIIHNFVQAAKNYKICAVLSGNNTTGIEHAVNQVARHLGIPVLSWQHGFIMPHKDLMQFYEFSLLMTSDFAFVYGDKVKRILETYQHKFAAKVRAIGAPSLDRIKVSISETKQKMNGRNTQAVHILYATTNYYQNSWYVGFSPPFRDCCFYRDQLFIMNSLQKLVKDAPLDITVTVKLHPNHLIDDPPWIRDFNCVEKVVLIKRRPSFSELLLSHDVVLLDVPTTTSLQAISTKLPVFTLMSHWRYPREARALLEKRAICMDNVQTLMDAIRDYLYSSNYNADIEDNSFLKMYGLHEHDGKSAERAVKEVLEIIEGKNGSRVLEFK